MPARARSVVGLVGEDLLEALLGLGDALLVQRTIGGGELGVGGHLLRRQRRAPGFG